MVLLNLCTGAMVAKQNFGWDVIQSTSFACGHSSVSTLSLGGASINRQFALLYPLVILLATIGGLFRKSHRYRPACTK